MQSFFIRTTKTLVIFADEQADLSLYLAHMSEGTFSYTAVNMLSFVLLFT